MTEEELQERLDNLRRKRLARDRPDKSREVLGDAFGTGLRYVDRAVRLGGLGVGAAVSAPLSPLRAILPEGTWLRPGDVSESLNAFRAFNEQRKLGDWDAGIAAAQDEFDAGPGFWGTSELLGEIVIPGGQAKLGSRLIRNADRFGDFAKAARVAGKGMRLPWEAEEAVGRAITKPVVGAFRGARRLLRGDPEDPFADISEQLALPPGREDSPTYSLESPVTEYLDEGVVSPTTGTARPMPGDILRTPESAYDEWVGLMQRGETPSPELREYLEQNQPAMQAILRERLAAPTSAADAPAVPGAADEGISVTRTDAGYVIKGYHGTRESGLPTQFGFGGLHIGTRKAALDRLEQTPSLMPQGVPGAEKVLPVEMTLRKPYGSLENPIGETELFTILGLPDNPKIGMKRLTDEGYDGVIYKNNTEDPGSISVLAFDPTASAARATVDERRLMEIEREIETIDGYIEELQTIVRPPKDHVQVSKTGKKTRVTNPLHAWTDGMTSQQLRRIALEEGRNPTAPDWYANMDSVVIKEHMKEKSFVPLLGDKYEPTIPGLRKARRLLIDERNEILPPKAKTDRRLPRVPAEEVTTPTAARPVPLTPGIVSYTTRQVDGVTEYLVNGNKVDKATYDAARASERASAGVGDVEGVTTPVSRAVTMSGRAADAPPGGRRPPGAGDGEIPPPEPPTPSYGDRIYGENTGPVRQLQDIGAAIKRSIRTGAGRTAYNRFLRIPKMRAIFGRFNPSAIDTDTKGQALYGRSILMEEGKQKADQAFAYLSRGGTQEQVFGRADDSGLLMEGPLRGQYINDVRSNPTKYANRLTVHQKKWIQAADDIERSKLSFLKINGIDVKELDFSRGGQYAGRRLVAVIDNETGQIESLGIVRKGLKQETSSEKHRYFPTIEDAQAHAASEGKRYVYVPEDEALLYNLRDAYRRVTEKRFSEWALDNIKELKRGPVPKGIPGEPKAYKLVSSSNTPPDLKGAYFTGPQAEALAREFDASLEALVAMEKTQIGTAITKANAIGRFMTLNGDAGQFLIQLLFLSNFSPRIWGKSIGAFTRTLFSTRYHSNLINNNRDLLARHPNLITSLNGTEMTEALQKGGYLTTSLGVPGRMIARTLEPFGRAFGGAMDDAGINLAKALESRALLPDRGPYDPSKIYTRADFDTDKLDDIDDFINEMRGIASSARIGVSNKQQMLESMVLLAPRYNRAIAALLYDAGRGLMEPVGRFTPAGRIIGKETTIRGDLGRQALIRSVVGLTSLASAISLGSYMMQQNKDGKPLDMEEAIAKVTNHINPASPRFFEWEMNGVNIGPGTKVRTLLGFASKTISDPSSFQDVASRFARGQGAPVIGAAWDSLTGFGYMGEPTPIGVGAFGQSEYWDDYNDKTFPDKAWEAAENQVLPHFIPVWIQGMLMSNGTTATSALDRAKMGTGEFFGLRTSPLNRTQLAVEIAREQGLASNTDEYNKLSGVLKERIDGILDRELGPRDYRGKTGKLYEEKDKENIEYVEKLTELSKDVDKGIIGGDFDTRGFDPQAARRAFIKMRDLHNQKLVGINAELYGEDLDEEPELNTREHDLWGYYQIYKDLDDLPDDEKFEVIAEAEAAYWANLNQDAVFDDELITGIERVEYILDSIRVIEDKYPAGLRRMVDAMRYSGSIKQDILGEELSYWDLNTHTRFIDDMRFRTGLGSREIKEFLDRPYAAQRTLARDEGSDEQIIFDAAEKSKREGVLKQLRAEFINQAPDEWILGMLYAGYTFGAGKLSSARIAEQLRKQIANGATIPDIDFKDLYAMSLAS